MPGIIDPQQAPPDGAVLDLDHPLAQGLVACLVPTAAGNVVDLMRDRGSGPAILAPSPRGPAARDWSIPPAQVGDLQFATGRFSVAALFDLSTGTIPDGQYASIVGKSSYTSESVNSGWSLVITPPDNGSAPNKYTFETRNNSSTAVSYTAGGTPSAGAHLLVGTMGVTADAALYLDGASLASNGSRVASSNSRPLANASTASVRAPVAVAYIWGGRTLTAGDVRSLWLEPFAPFRVPAARARPSRSPAPTHAYPPVGRSSGVVNSRRIIRAFQSTPPAGGDIRA